MEAKAWDGIMEETDNSHSPMEDVKPIIDGGHTLFLVLTCHNNL